MTNFPKEPDMNLPSLFLDRMKTMLGEEYPAFLASYDTPLCAALRFDPARIPLEAMHAFLPPNTERIPWAEHGFYYDPDGDFRPGKHPWHEAGVYYIQEASAQLPASLSPPRPGERVLDLCAAPGGKATALGAALRGQGILVANEIVPSRATILSRNIERMGIPNALVTCASPAELVKYFPAYFDRMVVDAPCSGEGMFRKEPQAAEMWSLENVKMCAARQLDILEEAAKMLAPGGYLTYSTCTFAPEENEGVLMRFLSTHGDFSVVTTENARVTDALSAGLLTPGRPEWVKGHEAFDKDLMEAARRAIRVFPHRAHGEGHFAVLLRRAGERQNIPVPQHKDKLTHKPDNKRSSGVMPLDRAVSLFKAFADDCLVRIPEGTPVLLGDRLWLLPPDPPSPEGTLHTLDGLRILRAGLCLGACVSTGKTDRFVPDHALALALSPKDIRDAAHFPLDTTCGQDTSYLHGETLPAPASARGWCLVTVNNHPLGWAKAGGGIMKNHYPKGLRR